MRAFKGFHKNLTCRGYQFQEKMVHQTLEANCRQNGFHCAENPLDCLDYYRDWNNSVYYIVNASGDINEDENDSKISCTEMVLVKKLTLNDFIFESIVYMVHHPMRDWHHRIIPNKAMAETDFTIVRGKQPIALGKSGTILGIVKEYPESRAIMEIAILEIDGNKYMSDTWYDVSGQEVEDK